MKVTVKLPNFSLTRGQLPPDVAGAGPMPRRNYSRTIRKFFLWGAVVTVFFLLFAWLSIPTSAIAWRVSHEARKAGIIVAVEDVSVMPWGTITLENVKWTFEPSRPDTPPSSYALEEVEVDIGLFALLMGDIDVELEAEIGTDDEDEGRIFASYERDKNKSAFGLKIEDVPLYRVPKAAQAINAPIAGLLAVEADISIPENKFSQAHGSIEITCAECAVGDGETKLYIPGSKGLKDGVTIPEIQLGTMVGRMGVEDGVALIDGAVETESEDLEAKLTGSFKLNDKFQRSRFEMVLKVSLSDDLQGRSERIRIAYQTANPKARLEGEGEKGLGYRLEGSVTRPKFVPINSKSRRQRLEERRQKRRERDEKRRKAREKKKKKKPMEFVPGGKDKDDDKDKKDEGGDEDGKIDVEPLEPPPPEEPPAEPEPPPPPEPPVEEPAADEGAEPPPPALPPPGDPDVDVYDPNADPNNQQPPQPGGDGGSGGRQQ